VVAAPIALTERLSWEEQAGHLLQAGYTRLRIDGALLPLDPLPKRPRRAAAVRVVIDRFTWRAAETGRLAEAAEQAFRRGEGRLELILGNSAPESRSERWECSRCGGQAVQPEPALFSFNSPLGCCPECRGF